MAGEAKTNQFNLSDATVMIGEQGKGTTLTPEQHSIGLAKNVVLSTTKQRVELTQGLLNEVVDSQVTGNDVSISFDVYEYTAKNLAYAAGVDGAKMVSGNTYLLKDGVNGDGDTVDSVDIVTDTDVSGNFRAGQNVMIQAKASGANDRVALCVVEESAYTAPTGGEFATGTITLAQQPSAGDVIRIAGVALTAGTDFLIGDDVNGTATNLAGVTKITAVTLSASDAVVTVTAAEQGLVGNAITLSTPDPDTFTLSGATLSGGVEGTHGILKITFKNPLPEGMSFIAGDSVITANFIPAASNEETPYKSLKLVFVLPNNKEPVVAVIEKCRITNGFQIASGSQDYNSMPFEVTPYALLPEDEGYDRTNTSRIRMYRR